MDHAHPMVQRWHRVLIPPQIITEILGLDGYKHFGISKEAVHVFKEFLKRITEHSSLKIPLSQGFENS